MMCDGTQKRKGFEVKSKDELVYRYEKALENRNAARQAVDGVLAMDESDPKRDVLLEHAPNALEGAERSLDHHRAELEASQPYTDND